MRCLLLLCLGCFGFTPIVRADDPIYSATIPLNKPRKEAPRGGGPLDKVELSIWLPPDVKIIRGAVVNPFHLKTVEQQHWRAIARQWGFALVGANYFAVDKKEFGSTLLAALRQFGDDSKHPELANIPLAFVGMSAGAGMSVSFAEALPDRTIAVAPVCLEVGPRDRTTQNIPMVTIFGERDGKQMPLLLEKLPIQRKEGAKWAIAVQWGRGHEFGYANNLVVPFFDAVIRQRYPAEMNPLNGPVKLLDYPDAPVRLGDPFDWKNRWASLAPPATLDADRSCWLPNEDVATIWRAFNAHQPTVKITAPAGLGDGQVFSVHSSKNPIAFQVNGSSKPKLPVIELFAGAKSLGQMKDGRAEVTLARGLYGIYAVGIGDDGSRSTSRPITIVVE